ncbi:uncharacterized protein EV420DRAFT_467657 [Desarmillaria tabescens]|uniref:GST N-terminal domain-containing protein n=1 Tax=Armillaria tabescens TaxID=1929756 RepID=A0AA39NMM4_ARMTA|nr:uncharacterized protein EV420DRAFT_467657 [Desarmillaria tabescens]KAK0468457.1 hypothetical protein EV420DRAFT_467657 [Desarmillaria tabescens]
MSEPPSVVIYRYDASPFSVKVDNVLLLKNIPHHKVNVASLLPRPEITELLGLGYRRIPVLAIGNDVYCDTSLICSVLERKFPTTTGHGTLFPPRKQGGSLDTTLIKIYTKHYVDSIVFSLAVPLLPWEKFPEAFIKDRSSMLGPISVPVLAATRGRYLSLLSAHLALTEEQLHDGREWLFDTTSPSLADISLHVVYSWVKSFRTPETQTLFDEQKFPYVIKWLSRMTNHLDTLRTRFDVPRLQGEEAASSISASFHEPYDTVGFDAADGARLGFQPGDLISIAPDDTARKYPTVGQLVGLNSEEFVIETKGKFGIIRCHFPRIGYTASRPKGTQSKL